MGSWPGRWPTRHGCFYIEPEQERTGGTRLNKRTPPAILACAFLSAFLAPSDMAAAQAITVGATSSTSDAPIFIADKKGYFREEGLEVKVVNFCLAALARLSAKSSENSRTAI